MNYLKIYQQLIEKSRSRILNEYKERHHIVPRCLGGTDDISNIVELTPEEHYIAHLLLVKIYPAEDKLIYAAWYMQYHNSTLRMNNKMHGWLKRKFSETVSEKSKNTWKEKRDSIIESMIKERNTEEGKKRMKESAQKRWDNMSTDERNVFKRIMTNVNKNEIKRKDASIKIKEKWSSDESFKEKMKNRKTRGSDGSALKKKWDDPIWREKMMNSRKSKKLESQNETV